MMKTIVAVALGVAILFTFAAPPAPAEAQIWKKVKETAKKAAEGEVLKEVDERVRGVVQCAFSDLECIERAEAEGREVEIVDEDGNVVSSEENTPSAAPSASARPGEGAWANYDFVPGERVLFAEDFSSDNVGDFPHRLEFVRGNMEIVEWQGRRLLRGTGNDVLTIPLPESLPQRFTIEFEIHDPATEGGTRLITEALPENGRYEGSHINVGNWRGSGIWEGGEPVSTNEIVKLEEELVPIRIMVDGRHVKVYAREQRISNVPRVELARGNAITFAMATRTDRPIYLGNIRIAAGGRDLYDALATEGRVATQGILFDTGSDRIRPESTPTLEELGTMLTEHPDLRLTIEGHTDSVGDDAANQQLSEKRAAAVKTYLVSTYGIDASRLEAKGFGEAKPVADNDTPEGRQQNRRVELVRLAASRS